jgi:hypothetical protein
MRWLLLIVCEAYTIFNACAWDFKRYNEYGDMIFYNIIDENSCEVTSGGDDPEYNYFGSVTIPEYVISEYTESEPEMLQVVGIGDHAFYKQENMSEVVLPQSIFYIDDYAFAGTNLEDIELPHGLYSIGSNCFAGVKIRVDDNYITQPYIPYLLIPNTVGYIAEKAFSRVLLDIVEFEKNNTRLTEIPKQAFMNSSVRVLYIKSKIRRICEAAFSGCKELSGIHMNDGVQIIEDKAFYGHAKMKQLELPSTITDIGANAFTTGSSMGIDILYVNATRPPYCSAKESLGPTTVQGKYQYEITSTRLVVPNKVTDVYRTTYPWDRFPETAVSGRNTAGVNAPTVSLDDDAESIFSVDGIRRSVLQKGVNIVRHKDGTVRKVYRK